jgi:uncharacterized protein
VTDGAPTYAPGTPMWVDHTSPDVWAAARFYSELFGWQSEDLGEVAGHYTMFTLNGKTVAATSPPMSPDDPPAWSTYISTANIEETARRVEAAGGKTLMSPMQVMDQGSMGVFMDPTGAVFVAWQPAAMKGAELVNQVGGFIFNELATRDLGAAKSFYSKVFDWGAKSNKMPDGSEYVEWQVAGRSIGGGFGMGSMYPPQVPSHWRVYFAVANLDQAQESPGTGRPGDESSH